MRPVYLILAAFLLLSIFFTRWYLCTVRGMCEAATSWEIGFMIIAGLVVGFAAAWLLGERTFRLLRGQLGNLYHEKITLDAQLRLLERENQAARKHVIEWQQEGSLLTQVKKVTEPLLAEARRQVDGLEEELKEYRRRYDNLREETDAIRQTADRLRAELDAERDNEAALFLQPVTPPDPIVGQKKPGARSSFTPSSWQTRDDLTQISGIGPGIQKKLNDLGIYSYQQIAEFTPDDIERVTGVLRVFKGRIGRDNWIGQAAALCHR